MTDFKMPSLGADMDAGTLIEWLKQPGDRLRNGDVIAVVETQKGAIEIEVFHDAVLQAHLIEPGTEVAVGTPIARLGEGAGSEADQTGEAVAAAAAASEPSVSGPSISGPSVSGPSISGPSVSGPSISGPTGLPTPATAIASAPQADAEAVRRRITPAARKRAEDHGIDLADVAAGPDSIVGLARVAAAKTGSAGQPSRRKAGIDPVEMRKAVAAVMARSKREIPHYYVGSDLDLTALLIWLQAENDKRQLAERLLYAVPLIAALSRALTETPELNGHYQQGVYRPSEAVHAGIAVSMRGGGLIAPALPDAHRLEVDALRIALADLVHRVRSGRLRNSEMTMSTVTISNLGEGTADMLMPVIYPPQVAIIGCGQIRDDARFSDGNWHPRRVMTVTIAADHRVSDGRIAARFLKAVQKRLDHPEKL